MSITRRGFIAGALASTSLPGIARGELAEPPAPWPAQKTTVRRGRAIAVAPGTRTLVVAHALRHTIGIHAHAGEEPRLVDVGGQPVEVAISPDGRLAAVTTGFWDGPGLSIVDRETAKVRGRTELGPAPGHLAFTPDGARLIVAGGEQEGTVYVLETKDFTVTARAGIGRVPRGVAPARNGMRAWIALNGENRVVNVDLATGVVRTATSTPELPDRVAVSPDGHRLLVTHGGRGSSYVSEIHMAAKQLRSRYVGRLPSGVAWTSRGQRLVALGGAGEVVLIGRRGRVAHHQVAGAPRGLAVLGKRAWTVDALSGEIQKVRL
jgi:DNA-binding beta-propeller fold protein YncE